MGSEKITNEIFETVKELEYGTRLISLGGADAADPALMKSMKVNYDMNI